MCYFLNCEIGQLIQNLDKIIIFFAFEYKKDIKSAKITAKNPKIRVEILIKNQLQPKTIPKAAPNEAPLKTPKIPGETKGFTNIA